MVPASTSPDGLTVLLIHGGWHGSWCWEPVLAHLRPRGLRVLAPTLVGLAELSPFLAPDVTLSTHIDQVSRLVELEDADRVLVVGHSYGGLVAAGVASRHPERTEGLILIDAFNPQEGACVVDGIPPEDSATFYRLAREHGDGWRVPPYPAAGLGIDDPALAAWTDARTSPMPLAACEEGLRLEQPIEVEPRIYVHCRGWDKMDPVAAQASAGGYEIVELPCGHDAMLIMPEETAGIVLDAAARAGAVSRS